MSHSSEHSAHTTPCVAHREEHDLCTRVQAEFREMPGLSSRCPRHPGYSASSRPVVSVSSAHSSMRDTWRPMGRHSPARSAVADLRDPPTSSGVATPPAIELIARVARVRAEILVTGSAEVTSVAGPAEPWNSR